MARGFDNRWHQFAESKPRPVADGVATSRQRGAMAESWWSKRFTEVLDSYGLGARMQRGRRYARSGQVMSLEVEPGTLKAKVQGSRVRPYLVTVRLSEVSDSQWALIEGELAKRVGLIASLLAGEVPEELEEAFASAGVALLPDSWTDLEAACNCPDGASPCKHLAALLYVFADQLDRNPWLLLEWRGRNQDEILALLRTTHSAPSDPVTPWWPFAPGPIPESLLANADGSSGLPAAGNESALDRLEPIDVQVLGSNLSDLLRPAYAAFGEAASE